MKKKYILSIFVALLLSVVIMAISLHAQPVTVLSEAALESANSVLPVVTMTPVNATFSDARVFQTDGADAQLYIDGINDEVGALVFDFSEPLPENIKYQLYYAVDGSGLSEGYSVSGMTDKGMDSLIIQLPYFARYDALRLDIDTEYQLKDISIVNSKTMFDNMYLNDGDYLTGILRHEVEIPYVQFILCFAILLTEMLLLAWKWEAVKDWFRQRKNTVIENPIGILRGIVICLTCLAAGLVTWFCLYKTGVTHSRSLFTLFCFADVGLAIGLLIVMFRQLAQRCELGFLVIALCIGLLFAVLEPPTTLLSWDDEIHYGRAVCLNYGGTSYISDAERIVENRTLSNAISLENKLSTTHHLNAMLFRYGGNNNNIYTTMNYTVIAYLPSAAAMWLARMLGFSVSNTVIAGRVGNLLCYVFVAYAAIKRLKYGKLIAASLCLFPTILFLAGNYSYDAFCIAFILLGICLWLEVYQKPEIKMTGARAAIMLLAFVIGILPKTVYFPFMLIVLFLPKRCFSSKAWANGYRLAVIMTALLLMFTIVAVFFGTGSGGESFSDARGGADVSAQGQIDFILHNPMQYTNILLNYLFKVYFSLGFIMDAVGGCVRALAYVGLQGVIIPGKIAYAYLGLLLIAWLVSFDIIEKRSEKMPLWVKAICCILSFGVICIVATSMYCGFTPVGSHDINGCQERYMLPVIIPMLLVIRPAISRKRWRLPSWTNTVILYTDAILLMVGMVPFMMRFV